jgi:hypothetical protein
VTQCGVSKLGEAREEDGSTTPFTWCPGYSQGKPGRVLTAVCTLCFGGSRLLSCAALWPHPGSAQLLEGHGKEGRPAVILVAASQLAGGCAQHKR